MPVHYIETLLASRLPLPVWAVIAAWPALFVANHFVVRSLRELSAHQTWYVVENREAITRASRPFWMLAQVLYAACVFAFSVYAGGPVFAFFAGGLDVSLICVLGMNVQALLSTQAMSSDTVQGTMQLSTAFTLRQFSARLAGTALMCSLLGLLLAQLALLGGAALCAATASGYLRRAAALKGTRAV
jgi:hypothetical protein